MQTLGVTDTSLLLRAAVLDRSSHELLTQAETAPEKHRSKPVGADYSVMVADLLFSC
jgi:hypothetical protein